MIGLFGHEELFSYEMIDKTIWSVSMQYVLLIFHSTHELYNCFGNDYLLVYNKLSILDSKGS